MAKTANTRYCVTHCELPTEVSRGWNAERTEGSYSPEVFEDLAGRFESPDTKNRWDVPLLRVDPRSDSLATDVKPSIAVITGTTAYLSG
jgi:protein KTI12